MNEEKKGKVNLIFVCTGNTCRSPMAEQLFADYVRANKCASIVDISGAGMAADNGRPMTPEAAGVLAEMGLTVKPHRSRLLTVDLIQNADIIVCMTEEHRRALLASPTYAFADSDGGYRIVGTVAELTGEEVVDPYGRGVEAYRAAAEALKKMCPPLLDVVKRFRDEHKLAL